MFLLASYVLVTFYWYSYIRTLLFILRHDLSFIFLNKKDHYKVLKFFREITFGQFAYIIYNLCNIFMEM